MFSSGWLVSTFFMITNITVATIAAAATRITAKNPIIPILKSTKHVLFLLVLFGVRSRLSGSTMRYSVVSTIPAMNSPNIA
jgi:hypothetical protein